MTLLEFIQSKNIGYCLDEKTAEQLTEMGPEVCDLFELCCYYGRYKHENN